MFIYFNNNNKNTFGEKKETKKFYAQSSEIFASAVECRIGDDAPIGVSCLAGFFRVNDCVLLSVGKLVKDELADD